MNTKIVELKARAYDLLAVAQRAQQELIEVNSQIEAELAKINTPAPVEEAKPEVKP